MLIRFTIKDGNAQGTSSYNHRSGGGCYLSNGIVQNCKIIDNVSKDGGGGIKIFGSQTILYDCFVGNNK